MLDHPQIVVPDFIKADAEFMRVLKFSAEAHKAQQRKYTYEPYIIHPIEVATLFHTVCSEHEWHDHVPGQVEYRLGIITALMHDTVEDTGLTFTDLQHYIGVPATTYTFWATDPVDKTKGNRHIRKILTAQFIAAAPLTPVLIKMCDSISNLSALEKVSDQRGFAIQYAKEKQQFLDAVLKRHHPDCSPVMTSLRRALQKTIDRIRDTNSNSDRRRPHKGS